MANSSCPENTRTYCADSERSARPGTSTQRTADIIDDNIRWPGESPAAGLSAAAVSSALPHARIAAAALTDRPQAFFNALLTEHFVLESARGITVSESSSRASLYLTTLSSALVAFGFLAGSRFAEGFLATVIPVVVLLGVFTYERLVETSLEDVVALSAIQNIRRFYTTVLPGAETYFRVPVGPRAPNELLDIGRRPSWRGVFFTMSTAIAVVNSILAGAGGALLAAAAHASQTTTLVAGFVTGSVLILAHGVYQELRYSSVARLMAATDADRRGTRYQRCERSARR